MKHEPKQRTRLKVLATGSEHFNHSLLASLSGSDVEAVSIPLLEIRPIPFKQTEIERLTANDYAAVVFSSVNAVDCFVKIFSSVLDRFPAPSVPLLAVGAKTAKLLEAHGLKVSFTPEEFSMESLMSGFDFSACRGRVVLYPTGNQTGDELEGHLAEKGVGLEKIIVYENRLPEGSHEQLRKLFREGPPDCIAVASPTAAGRLESILGREAIIQSGARIVAIGEKTARALKVLELPPTATAASSDSAGVAATLFSGSNR